MLSISGSLRVDLMCKSESANETALGEMTGVMAHQVQNDVRRQPMTVGFAIL